MELELASACQNILETRMKDADQSVSQTLTAHTTRLACSTNVQTPVQEPVAQMLNALFITMLHRAVADRVTQEIRSDIAHSFPSQVPKIIDLFF